MVILFGAHAGKELKDIPSSYLKWMVENMDPEPLPRLRRGMTVEQISEMRDTNKSLISEAEDILLNREQT
jgi:uncharacterized protein (DUF3820 family)